MAYLIRNLNPEGGRKVVDPFAPQRLAAAEGTRRSEEANLSRYPQPLRLALWSGPRNISTAMMRSFESRSDSTVTDEPLYSHYLRVTGLPHPGRDEVIAHYESDWRKVVAWLTGPVPEGKSLWYQKHMSHHLLPMIDREAGGWLSRLENCFLIREPRAMLSSLAKVTPNPTIEDTGLPQQVELFEQIRARRGAAPPVVDARDVLVDPRRTLSALCRRVGIDFQESMLSWPPGRRRTDGIWAEHWYAEVERSTGFAPYRPKGDDLPERLEPLAEQCLRLYDVLAEHRLYERPSTPECVSAWGFAERRLAGGLQRNDA